MAIAIVQYYYVKKQINIQIFTKAYLKYIVSGVLMFLTVYVMGIFMETTIITTILQICVGGIIYIGSLLIMKDKFLCERLDKILRTLKIKK